MSTVNRTSAERGVTLIELLAALVVISIGVLAVIRLFPAGERNQLQDRMMTTANHYAQEKLEYLGSANWTGPDLTPGRHPVADAESLGTNNKISRFYEVENMAAPLDNLKKVTVTVGWTVNTPQSVVTTTYLRR
jgi:prepilin-type N-terminal cleavage/methylation domain-containing protein